jgi:hypothetical protein
MVAFALCVLVNVAPTGAATKLVAIWTDHGSPYMELRPDGSGRIGALQNTWSADKDVLHVAQKDDGTTYDITFTLLEGGKKLRLMVQNQPVDLDRSKQKPAAKAPPPPKPPSQIENPDSADAGTKTPKKKAKAK